MKSKIWDKKSSSYPRYSDEMSLFEQAVFLNFYQNNLNFDGKSLIDIGCGTGIWSLRLAKMCKNVTSLDSSDGMLDVLRLDALKHGVENINLKCSSWQEYNDEKLYDIAFCTMSPALSTDEDFKKFLSCAKVRVFANFNSLRSSTLLDGFFKKFEVEQNMHLRTQRFEEYLRSKKLNYTKFILPDLRIKTHTKQTAIKSVCWHLEIGGAKYDESQVTSMVKEMFVGDEIQEEIKSLIAFFIL